MSLLDRSRLVAALLTLVPGWGHVYWGREVRGMFFFTAFAVAGFAFLNGLFLYLGAGRSVLIGTGGGVLLVATLWAWIDILLLTSPRRSQAYEGFRMKALQQGTLAYLQGDLAAAKAAFADCLRQDPADVEALFRLGVVTARAGEAREARALLRRASRLDLDEKWTWEIERELGRLGASDQPAARKERELVPRGASQSRP